MSLQFPMFVIFLNCVFYVQYVHLNVVGSRYANLALLCILLPHELPPCVCTKIWVQNQFEVSLTFFCHDNFHEIFYIFHSFYESNKSCCCQKWVILMHPKVIHFCASPKVSRLGVVALWRDCTFIMADWGS